MDIKCLGNKQVFTDLIIRNLRKFPTSFCLIEVLIAAKAVRDICTVCEKGVTVGTIGTDRCATLKMEVLTLKAHFIVTVQFISVISDKWSDDLRQYC
ncbi:unnamed protein product [Enterobius vermicularis]|uniref:Pentatricopeptide repeat-containing protein n=1 Tax=Enterobius vermicularis TaxID=51028 RepID=A0A0N4V8D0_ENTVE|nr:unnamed protein product [Enterobius vermicularis]